MEITPKAVMELREKTGAGMMDCKRALQDAGGDFQKAITILREKGLSQAAKRAGKEAKEGSIFSYIHPGAKIGVILELNCETDFVARTADFQTLGKELTMQIAAASPLVVHRDNIPADVVAREKEIYAKQAEGSGKPANVIDKIVEGKLEKFYHEACLLDQPYIKNDEETVAQIVTATIAKLGENIIVRRFTRFQLGEDLS
ncbi:MAG: translation elongation factor Ts [Candidatus Krumholzibacteria bacterium]|nr:translation elongation factor Ts [Candidatus Krumholzibacteria bacterium]